jgi:crooked neck
MEEVLGNYDHVRSIFEDWMTWEPTENAWNAYLKFEERMGKIENCRAILERYIDLNPNVKSYLKAAKFEEHHKQREKARLFYEKALIELGKLAFDEYFFMQFTKFEIQNKEIERAKILFKYALDNIPKEKANRLYAKYVEFEKQYGSREDMEDAIVTKKRHTIE